MTWRQYPHFTDIGERARVFALGRPNSDRVRVANPFKGKSRREKELPEEKSNHKFEVSKETALGKQGLSRRSVRLRLGQVVGAIPVALDFSLRFHRRLEFPAT
jgi:hypothetical protein